MSNVYPRKTKTQRGQPPSVGLLFALFQLKNPLFELFLPDGRKRIEFGSPVTPAVILGGLCFFKNQFGALRRFGRHGSGWEARPRDHRRPKQRKLRHWVLRQTNKSSSKTVTMPQHNTKLKPLVVAFALRTWPAVPTG